MKSKSVVYQLWSWESPLLLLLSPTVMLRYIKICIPPIFPPFYCTDAYSFLKSWHLLHSRTDWEAGFPSTELSKGFFCQFHSPKFASWIEFPFCVKLPLSFLQRSHFSVLTTSGTARNGTENERKDSRSSLVFKIIDQGMKRSVFIDPVLAFIWQMVRCLFIYVMMAQPPLGLHTTQGGQCNSNFTT